MVQLFVQVGDLKSAVEPWNGLSALLQNTAGPCFSNSQTSNWVRKIDFIG